MNPKNYSKFFKSYDIRGTYPQIDEQMYYQIGKSFVSEVLEKEGLPKKICLMRDHRYTSPQFYRAIYNGIIDAKGEVLALGLGSSDMLYAACQLFDLPGAIVTASHNPKDDNGLKIVKSTPEMLGLGNGLEKIRDKVVATLDQGHKVDTQSFLEPKTEDQSKAKLEKYYLKIIKEIGGIEQVDQALSKNNQKLKICVDAGNGMGGYVMNLIKDLYSQIKFVPLYWELDGNYPNHPADPQNFSNLEDLKQQILKNNYNFGFAFDGDADRVFFLDEYGQVVQGDFLISLFAEESLQDHYHKSDQDFNPVIVVAQPGSQCVVNTVYQADGCCVPTRQGHTNIKTAMQDYKAIYGGEFSGHHYFGKFGYMDSGILAAVLMIKIIVEKNQKMSNIFHTLRQNYHISDLINLKLPAGVDFEIVKQRILAGFADAQKVSFLDGISLFFPDWKFSVRPSQTEPVIRFILETYRQDKIQEKLDRFYQVIGFGR